MGDVKTNLGHALDHGRWRRSPCHHAAHPTRHTLAQGRVGLDDQVVHDGRCTVMVDIVLAHGLQNRWGIHFAQAHMGAAEHRHRPRKTPAIAMEHRQGPQVTRKVRHGPSGRVAHRVQVGAAVVGDHALGVAGGARCVGNRNRVPFVRRPVQLGHRRVGRQPFFVIQAAHALTRAGVLGIAHIDHRDLAPVHLAEFFQSRAHGGRKLGIGDQHRGLAMVHLPSDQVGIEPGVQGIEHGVERGHSVMHLDHFRGIGQHHADRGPLSHTQALQGGGQAGRTLTHLGPGVATLAMDDSG